MRGFERRHLVDLPIRPSISNIIIRTMDIYKPLGEDWSKKELYGVSTKGGKRGIASVQ